MYILYRTNIWSHYIVSVEGLTLQFITCIASAKSQLMHFANLTLNILFHVVIIPHLKETKTLTDVEKDLKYTEASLLKFVDIISLYIVK